MSGIIWPWMLSAPSDQLPAVERLVMTEPRPAPEAGRLRVATLNIAHGRGAGSSHQATTSARILARNLSSIGAVLRAYDVDCAALQEVDHKAWWTGGHAQADAIARDAGMPWVARGNQVDRLGLRYGTALLSTAPLTDCRAVAFAAGPATPGKGFTTATVQLANGRMATVVSLHLHFLPGSRQEMQLDELVAQLRELPPPLIVMGDFNAGWQQGRGLVADCAARLGLTVWEPERTDPTLRGSRRRIDWILVSPPLVISERTVIDAVPSDHRLVLLDLRWPLPGSDPR